MIYTFYSFKGGVGRSMALANVAELLYRRGLKVLIVDFDLEAPGLERFFEVPDAHPIPQILDHRGVIDMLTSYKELRSVATLSSARPDQAEEKSGSAFPFPVEPLSSFIVPIYEQANTDGALLLMPAGRRSGPELTRYAQRVQSFDWDDFYVNWNGEQFFDWFRQETEAIADIVLVDSRTGFTEMSGVCTFHLADVVIMFVAANQQNLDGTLLMARSLQGESLIAEGRKGRPLWLLFAPSRIEQSESDLLDHFADQFLMRLTPYISPELRFETNAFIDLKIPYVPRYAYLESVAVREPDRPVAADLISAYNRLTSAMIEIAPRSSTLYAKFQAPTREIGAIEEALAPPVEFFTGRTRLFHHIEQWLASDGPPLLTVIGAPGSGKTALVSRLAEMSRSPVPGASQRLSSLTAVYLCNPMNRVTLDPLHFVESIFRQLAVSYPSIAVDLAGESPTGVRIDVKQTIGSVKSNAQVVGVQVERLNVTGLSPLVAFDLLIRRPLHLLCRGDFRDTVLIAVDGVEAAVDVETKESILSVITYAILGESGLPRQVRLLLTSRSDPRVLASVKGMVVNLDEDAEATLQDIRQYAHARLVGVAPERRDQLAYRIADASGGNFMYARLVLDELQKHPDSEASVGTELPRSLIDIYRTSLQAITSSSPRRWEEHDHAFLGVLAAARAPGLTTTQLAGILQRTRLEVRNLLQTWGQFLSGEHPDGPFRFYHSSFRDFLLTDREFGIDVGESHQAIVEFLLKEREEPFDPDDYLVTNLLGHLVEAIRTARGASVRERLLNALWSLLFNVTFLAEVDERGRMGQITMDLEAALSLPGLGDGAEFLQILLELARSDPQEMIRVIRSADHPDLQSRFGLAIDAPYEVSIRVATRVTEIFGGDVTSEWNNRLDSDYIAELTDRGGVSTDQYGSVLFSTAFPPPAADLLRSLILETTGKKRCRIRLIIDPGSPELNDLWWETLRDEKSPRVRFARSDRTPFSREVARAIAFDQRFAPADGLRVLVALAEDQEPWVRRQALNLPGVTVDVEPLRGVVDLRSRLSKDRYHVLHLVTAGALADGSVRLRLGGEDFQTARRLISDTTLADLLLDLPDLRLVVLSGLRQELSSGPVFVRIAASLIASGFPAALALQTPLTEALELLFFGTMYAALGRPAPPPLDVAVNEAREALFFKVLDAPEDDSWLWAAPVLYLNGDGRLFQGHSSGWEPSSTKKRRK